MGWFGVQLACRLIFLKAYMSDAQKCCPKDWQKVPDVTGSYELDGWVSQCANTDMRARLVDFCGVITPVYAPKTAYGPGLG